MAAPVFLRDLGVYTDPTGAAVGRLQVTNPAGSQTGVTSILAISLGVNSGVTIVVTDSQGGTWQQDSNSLGVFVFSRSGMTPLAAGSDWIQMAFTGLPANKSVIAEASEFSGILAVSYVDTHAESTGAGTTPSVAATTGTFSTLSKQDLVYSAFGYSGGVAGDPVIGATFTAGDTSCGASPQSVAQSPAFYALGTQYVIEPNALQAGSSESATLGMVASSATPINYASCLVAYKVSVPKATLVGVGVLTSKVHKTATLIGVGTLTSRVKTANTLIGVGVLTSNAHATVKGKATLVGVGRLTSGRLYGLFNDLGLLIGRINAYGSYAASNFGADLNKIENGFLAKPDIDGLFPAYTGFGDQIVQIRQALAGYCDTRLQDLDRVIRELHLTASASIDDILNALGARMVEDLQTVNRSTVTIGAINPDILNNGNGTVLTTKVLDGVTQPSNGMPARLYYNGLNSELAVASETMSLLCTDDSTEGAEVFAWKGAPSADPLTWRPEGSGDGPSISVSGGSTIVPDGNFELAWPGSWLDPTGIGQFDTYDAVANPGGQFYRGKSSLLLAGVNGTATLDMTSAMNTNRKRYVLMCRILASYAPVVGTLTIGFQGTGYTPAGSEQITLGAGTFPTSWTLYNCWVNTPIVLPANWALQITTANITSDVKIWIDCLFIDEARYFGGIGLNMAPGSKPFRKGDSFQFTLGNDQASKFNEFCRARWGSQWPSSVSPSVSDTLAA